MEAAQNRSHCDPGLSRKPMPGDRERRQAAGRPGEAWPRRVGERPRLQWPTLSCRIRRGCGSLSEIRKTRHSGRRVPRSRPQSRRPSGAGGCASSAARGGAPLSRQVGVPATRASLGSHRSPAWVKLGAPGRGPTASGGRDSRPPGPSGTGRWPPKIQEVDAEPDNTPTRINERLEVPHE
jgi:hypothetical protein